MTKSQNETILTMRRALCGYTQISEKTGLSVGAIKSYCYRNGLNTASLKNSSGFCKNCGKPILNPSKTRPENFAPMPVKQRGGIFIVTTTRTAHQLSNSNVMSAVRSLQISAVRKESIAPALAIRKEVVRMIDKHYSSLISYKSAMAQAKLMYSKGIITAEEYGIIETRMCEKFGINSCSIFRDNEWINTLFRGNMSDTKEAK